MTDHLNGRWLLKMPDEDVDRDVSSVAGGIFFHMWATRQEPYGALTDGDSVYFVESHTSRIIWELRTRHIRRDRYSSMEDAYRFLRESYGLFPEDCNDYILSRPAEGWFLGWAIEVIRPLDVEPPVRIDFGSRGGRHGYLPFARVPGVTELLNLLPSPGSPALVDAGSGMLGGSVFAPRDAGNARYIPRGIRRAVLERDNGRCRECGATDRLHFDHMWPFSKGGRTELGNIQLLCWTHNLAKAARLVVGAVAPPDFDRFEALAESLGIPEPQLHVRELVQAAVAAGRAAGAADALLEHLDVSENPLDLLPALQLLGTDDRIAALCQARLAFALAFDHPKIARKIATELLEHGDGDVKATAALALAEAGPERARRQHLETAAAAEDQWVAGKANLLLGLCLDETEGRDEYLRRAAESPSPQPRAVAAYELGVSAEDACEAQSWFRRALVTQDHELFALCLGQLATLLGDDRACVFAERAVATGVREAQAMGHLVLGARGCDDDAAQHLRRVQELDDIGDLAAIAAAALANLDVAQPDE